MQTPAENQVLRCVNIIVSPKGITEADGNKVVIFIPANEIERITLKFGRAEHNPIVSLSIGVVLALAGLLGLVEIFRVPRGWRYETGMMILGVVGGSLIFDALKQRYFFEIQKKNGVRRLVFSKTAQKIAIENFCKEVCTVYKHEITEELVR